MDDIRKGSCPLCRHHEIIQATPQVHGFDTRDVRLAITAPSTGFLGPMRRALKEDPEASVGTIVIYACRDCGYSQSFVVDAAHVPIGSDYGTRLIQGGKSDTPYR